MLSPEQDLDGFGAEFLCHPDALRAKCKIKRNLRMVVGRRVFRGEDKAN